MSISVLKINAFFRHADMSDVEEIQKKIILSERQNKIFEMYYIKKQDRGFIADTLYVSQSVVSEELKSIREKLLKFL